ncbi:hypothetical protein V5O48_017249 [Marasmius crinis-equi]|uniref:Uncharacterized protein n=1 Tax=Marasmius crinis-equi TaxID=585013 RepID=A0ABR3EPQ9_9AGAR
MVEAFSNLEYNPSIRSYGQFMTMGDKAHLPLPLLFALGEAKVQDEGVWSSDTSRPLTTKHMRRSFKLTQ